MATLRQLVGWALGVQVTWAILAALWNFAGVALVRGGGRALGPTGSIAGGLVLVVAAAGLPIVLGRWPLAYGVLSGLFGLVALGAVVNAFRADPSLWPSEFWRYAGALLNAVGAVAAGAAVIAPVRYWLQS
jgi:hypothetical protein